MYESRVYRNFVNCCGLARFHVVEGETDLLVMASKNLYRQTQILARQFRQIMSNHIKLHPAFKSSLKPLPAEQDSPEIIQAMYAAGQKAGVGPMAAVAGAIAEFTGRKLLAFSDEVIIENGGDIFLKTAVQRRVAIFAGSSPLSAKIGLAVPAGVAPVGICTSSGTVGPSLSFGKADAAVAISPSCILADAAATAIGNAVTTAHEIDAGLEIARSINGICGAVIIAGEKLGAWGDIELLELD